MEDLSKMLCGVCDSKLTVDEYGDKHCPSCEKQRRRQAESDWISLVGTDPSGFGDSDND